MTKKEAFDFLSSNGKEAIKSYFDCDNFDEINFNDFSIKNYNDIDYLVYHERVYTNDFMFCDNLFICNDCGTICEYTHYVEDCDYYVCDDCACDYHYCEHCNCLYSGDGGEFLDNYNRFVCNSCLEERYCQCADCGDYIENCDAYYTHYSDYICERCYSNSYFTCDDCGDIYHNDDANYCENDDAYYCVNCIDFHSNDDIIGYHSFDRNDYILLKDESIEHDGDDNIYFGAEFENEGDRDDASYVIEHLGDLIHCEEDGSLSNGFEMITMPMTFNKILKERARIDKVFNYLIENGHRAHDTKTCGLHIHINKKAFKNDKAIKRFIALIDFDGFYNNYTIFNRRTECGYCHFNHLKKGFREGDIIQTSDHYNVVNVRSKDIEVRMFKGTLKINTYIACCEFLKNAIKLANDDTRDYYYFYELMNGENIDAYLSQYNRIDNIDANATINLYNFNHNKVINNATAESYELEMEG